MRKFVTLGIVIAGFLSASYAIGQVYNDKSELITGPMDRVAEKHLNEYQMNVTLDNAIERHFNFVSANQAR